MTDFNVEPAVVAAAGDDLSAVRKTLDQARSFVQANVHYEGGGGGTLLAAIGAQTNVVRDRIVTDYAPTGYPQGMMEDAAEDLRELARDYVAVDAEARARFDDRLPGARIEFMPEFTGEAPGVELGDYSSIFTVSARSSTDAYDTTLGITRTLQYVLGFDWIRDLMGLMGLPDPLADLEKKVQGDWTPFGRAIDALGTLPPYWDMVRKDVDAIPTRFVFDPVDESRAAWSGNAANMAIDWFQRLGSKVSDHGSNIGHHVDKIRAEAFAFKQALDLVADVLDEIIAFVMMTASGLEQLIEEMLANVAKLTRFINLVARLIWVVRAALLVLNLLWVAVEEVFALRSMEFPQGEPYTAPDVNGP